MKRKETRVRYVSPFGSPAIMTRAQAIRHHLEDTMRWDALEDAENEGAGKMLTDAQRRIGPPYIEELPR